MASPLTRKDPIIETTTHLPELLSCVGTVVQTPAEGSSGPIVVRLADHRFHCDPREALVFASMKDVHGRSMVLLQMVVGSFTSTDLDIQGLRSWIGDRRGIAADANFTITTARPGDDRIYTLWVGLTIPESALSETVIRDGIDFLYRAYNDALSPVTHLQRRRKIENYRAEVRQNNTEAILAELDAMVGLQPVKTQVRQLAARQMVARLRKNLKFRVPEFSPHLVFTGNPGTGKTTIARQIGRIYKQMGLLKSGHVVETNRSNLVGGYVGQTALKTTEVCKSALGGVLFIDEAYSLSGSKPDYGQEAIETLLTFMEAHRGEFVVIVAGYPKEMGEFLEMNPGLRSRFDLTIDFPDYSNTELVTIFRQLLKSHDYRMAADAVPAVEALMQSLPRNRSFGNAREVRRLFDQVVCNHALTLMGVAKPSELQLQTITRRVIELSKPTAQPMTEVAQPQTKTDPGSWPGYL